MRLLKRTIRAVHAHEEFVGEFRAVRNGPEDSAAGITGITDGRCSRGSGIKSSCRPDHECESSCRNHLGESDWSRSLVGGLRERPLADEHIDAAIADFDDSPKDPICADFYIGYSVRDTEEASALGAVTMKLPAKPCRVIFSAMASCGMRT